MGITVNNTLTVLMVYVLFFGGCFYAFIWSPYVLIRFIVLKKYLKKVDDSNNCYDKKCLSKKICWGLAFVLSPLTSTLVVNMCVFLGDNYFLGFYMLLGSLAVIPIIASLISKKLPLLEDEVEYNYELHQIQ